MGVSVRNNYGQNKSNINIKLLKELRLAGQQQ